MMANQTSENTASVDGVAASEQKTSRGALSKWALLSVAVLAVALLGYGYSSGQLQQITRQAGTALAAYVPAAAKTDDAQGPLTVARAAFAAGDMKAAIEAYRAHIAGNPADMTAQGELGNVLYTVGALPEAAQAYSEVANMALEQNHPEIAEALLPAISEGNPQLADQLNDKLFQAQMREDMARPIEGAPQQPPSQQPG